MYFYIKEKHKKVISKMKHENKMAGKRIISDELALELIFELASKACDSAKKKRVEEIKERQRELTDPNSWKF